jgi:hypothetical protein
MPREIIEPVTDENGDEHHPAFGMAQVSRIMSTPGQVLFDSDLRHSNWIEFRISEATRSRALKRDWVHAGRQVASIGMSMAQWASLVASPDTEGVPVTITYRDGGALAGDGSVPGLPYQPRLAVSMQETHNAAEAAFGSIREAMSAYQSALDCKLPAKERNSRLANLTSAIRNATANVDYAGKQFVAAAEDVVERSRADIEAMVARHAEHLGLGPTTLAELEQGSKLAGSRVDWRDEE